MGEIVLKKYDAFPNCKGLSESLGLCKADELPVKFIGWGPWKKQWYSICCKHQYPVDETCELCKIGSYLNVWQKFVGSLLYKVYPRLWVYLANRNNKKFASRGYGNEQE